MGIGRGLAGNEDGDGVGWGRGHGRGRGGDADEVEPLGFSLVLQEPARQRAGCDFKRARRDAENHRGRKNSLFLPVPPSAPFPGPGTEALVPRAQPPALGRRRRRRQPAVPWQPGRPPCACCSRWGHGVSTEGPGTGSGWCWAPAGCTAPSLQRRHLGQRVGETQPGQNPEITRSPWWLPAAGQGVGLSPVPCAGGHPLAGVTPLPGSPAHALNMALRGTFGDREKQKGLAEHKATVPPRCCWGSGR